MVHDYIYKEAKRIVNVCGTRDPFKIARELGIRVEYEDSLNHVKACILLRNEIDIFF